MRIGFFVNDIQTELQAYTTTRLAMQAVNRGHQVWYIGAGDFAYDVDEKVHARARGVRKKKYKSLKFFLKEIQGPTAVKERVSVDDLDVLMLRSNPSDEINSRPWAQNIGLTFGRVAMRHGVIVLNDPIGLSGALNKMYFQLFPEEVRPTTLITRDRKEIKDFAKDQGGKIVLKPLLGSGGSNVFLLTKSDIGNLNQIVDAISRDGYVIAQEYLPAAQEGDVRLFLMNGEPLKYRGRYAAFRRGRATDDIRSNIHAGGQKMQAVITDEHLRLAEMVRPKLVQDGMFLVGLDIVGDKLMEINVFSPGGLGSIRQFEKVNFTIPVLDAIEKKVEYMKYYRRNFDNAEMCTL